MSLTDDALEQVGRLFKENAELRERVEQVATQRDEWHRQNGLLRGERDAATARAEQAEAALAEMRERLGTVSGLPSLHRDDEIVLRYLDGTEHRLRITEARAVEPGSMEVSTEPATPRTALERAADEQGEHLVRCGTECSEGHTYEPGSCEAAVDPDEAIARNHADAMRNWGLDEQGEREGHGPNLLGGRCRNDTSGNSRA